MLGIEKDVSMSIVSRYVNFEGKIENDYSVLEVDVDGDVSDVLKKRGIPKSEVNSKAMVESVIGVLYEEGYMLKENDSKIKVKGSEEGIKIKTFVKSLKLKINVLKGA